MTELASTLAAALGASGVAATCKFTWEQRHDIWEMCKIAQTFISSTSAEACLMGGCVAAAILLILGEQFARVADSWRLLIASLFVLCMVGRLEGVQVMTSSPCL